MTTFGWIFLGGLGMSAIALVGSATLLMPERTLDRVLLPFVGSRPARFSAARSCTCCPQPSTRWARALGGLAVAGAFIADTRIGITAWLAAAAHEVPQELGDFGVLVHGGWKRGRALAYNAASGLTFLVGGLLAYIASLRIDVTFLLPFAAGNFLYIAASDLIPEVKHSHAVGDNLIHFGALLSGIGLMYLLHLLLG